MVALVPLLKLAGQYLYLTFTLRRVVLIAIVILGALPSTFLFALPMVLKITYSIGFVGLIAVAYYCLWGVYSGIAAQTIRMVWSGRKYKTIPYLTGQVREIANRMGVRHVDVFLTESPSITSAFTNMMTGRIGIPSGWIARFPNIESLVIIAHEMGHIKTRRIFFLELMAAIGCEIAFTYVLMNFSIQFFGQFAQWAFFLLAISFLFRRNEYRADREAAKAVSPEALKSVFEQLALNVKRDDGSETHPSFKSRIKRLEKLMEDK